ncbi:MAG: 4Fe-4S dicluster domain-containing protein [Desulfoplanes sp.]
MPKAFFIDTSRCTACRGCQIACKEWHGLPPVKTKQRGTHQNPPDLNPFNYKIVRFNEHLENDRVIWNFFPDQCRHCIDAPCKAIADDYLPGAIIQDEATGAILYTELTKQLSASEFEEIREACPYNIPRRNSGTGAIVKCDMCFDRVRSGLLPMCVATCPTGTMNFGERDEMLNLAHERLALVKKEFPTAQLVDEDSVSVIYLITDKPKNYAPFVMADAGHVPGPLSRKEFFAKLTPRTSAPQKA